MTTASLATLAAAPAISSSAMLAELSISVWTARKLDRAATKQTTDANNAAHDAGNFTKKLLASPTLEAVQKFSANTRQTHYYMTMPWSDLGMRLLTTTMFPDYYKFITGAHMEFDRLVQAFLDEYVWEQARAQARLGNLFNLDDYPPVETVARKFKFNYAQVPVPDAGDWRLDVNNDAQRELSERYAQYYDEQIKSAMADVWQRTYDALAKMSERLDYVSGEDKTTRKIFRDSLVENVQDMIGLLAKFNVTGDAKMETMRCELEYALAGVSPDALREDDALRHETKRKVDAVMSAMNW